MDKHFITAVLLRCFIYGFAFVLLWFLMFLLGGRLIYDFHNSMFDITRRQFEIIHYCGMGLLKLFVFVAFLIPYIAIRTAGNWSSSN